MIFRKKPPIEVPMAELSWEYELTKRVHDEEFDCKRLMFIKSMAVEFIKKSDLHAFIFFSLLNEETYEIIWLTEKLKHENIKLKQDINNLKYDIECLKGVLG